MSQVEVDKVIPQSGTTLTIGDSGDTINLVGTLQSNGSPLPGDISSVVAGTGLSGGGTTGAVTLNVEAAQSGITSLGTLTGLTVSGTGVVTNFTSTNNNTVLRLKGNNATNGGGLGSTSSDDLTFLSGLSEGMRLTSTGLGIGTSSPATPLHISGTNPTITFQETDQSNRKFQIGSFGNAYGIYDETNSQFRYVVDNSGNHIFNEGGLDCDFRVESNNNANMLFIDGNSDRVGIGTSSPAATLHVDASGGANVQISRTSQGSLYLESDGTNGNIRSTSSSGSLAFQTNGNNEKMRITSAGNVGIGTSSPDGQLHIVGDDATDQVIIENTESGSASAPDLVLFRNSASPADNDVLGRIDFRGDNSAGSAVDYMIMYATATDITDGTEDVRLIFEGKKAGSNAKLFTIGEDEVVVNDDSNDVDFRVESNANTHGLFVQGSSGKVGIGTSTPEEFLDISDNGPKIRLSDTSITNLRHVIASEANDLEISCDAGNVDSNSHIRFKVDGSEKMRITSDGDVGIGLTSPAHKLSVFDGSTGIVARFATTGNRSLDISSADNGIYAGAHWNRDVNSAGGIQSFSIEGNEKMRINATEVVVNEASADLDFRVETNSTSDFFIVNGADDKIYINRNSTISGSSAYLQIQNNYTRTGISTLSNNTAAHHAMTFHNPNGQVGSINTSGSSVVYNTSSDYRLKENVSYDFDATTRLKQLKPARFNFIADADTTVDGFLAHEVSSVVPEAISGTKDAVDEDDNPKYQGIDQSKLVPLLVKTIQELEARITTLENA